MLSVKSVAEEFGVTTDHILDLIHRGHLRAVNVGLGRKPRWKVPAEAITEFMAARTATANPVAHRKRRQSAGVVEFYPTAK